MNPRLLYCLIGVATCATVFSCTKHPGGPEGTDGGKIVYVESNDYHDNANAILAYRLKADGTLVSLPGSPFLTHGAGLGNPKQVLGPDDTDDAIVISDDGQYLLAVNGGSNTIAVFNISPNGSLREVAGSPFPSGGQTPCSIAINGQYVYVANKSFDPLHTITQLPNYTTFIINGAGRLAQTTLGKVEFAAGSAPSQVVLSNDKRFVFATNFLAFMIPVENPLGTLVSFAIKNDGELKLAPDAPYAVPAGDGGALGLAENPRSNTLYVGFPVSSSFGVYTINDRTGVLTYVTTVAGGPATCWLRTNAQGTRLYTLNSGENSVGVFNIENPNAPVAITKLWLKDAGTINAKGGTASQDFSLGFSPDYKTLYVVSQNGVTDFTVNNNWLHVLPVAPDGTLSEPSEPLQLPVGNDVRPQGVATR